MIFFLLLSLATLTYGRIYDRCELARDLKYVLNAPSHQIATWVCIAEHESQYNTSVVGYLSGDSGDHGIFQISDKFWCSPPGKGTACGITCSELEDDDISDDFICAQRIYKEHKTLSGDGFNAWAVYKPHCKGSKADRYIKDCFKDSNVYVPSISNNTLTDFAHGYFGSSAGRISQDFTISTEAPVVFDAFFTPRSSSPISDSGFYTQRTSTIAPTTRTQTPGRFFYTPSTTTTQAPSRFFYSQSTSTTQAPGRFFYTPSTTTTQAPSRFFFTPTTSSRFGSANRAAIFSNSRNFPTSSTNTFSTSNRFFIAPTASTNRFAPFNNRASNRASVISNSRTFSTPFTTRSPFFTSTTPRYENGVSVNQPVFIINGVKWI